MSGSGTSHYGRASYRTNAREPEALARRPSVIGLILSPIGPLLVAAGAALLRDYLAPELVVDRVCGGYTHPVGQTYETFRGFLIVVIVAGCMGAFGLVMHASEAIRRRGL